MTTKSLPKTAAEWEEYVNSFSEPGDFVKAMNNKGDDGFKAHLDSYVNSHLEEKTKESADIADQVKEFTQAALVDLFKGQGANAKIARAQAGALNDRLNLSRGGGVMAYLAGNKKYPGTALDGKFGDLGEFIQTVWHHRLAGKEKVAGLPDADTNLAIVNEYSTKIPGDGGFLVPEEYRAQLLMMSLESSIVLPRATVIPMNTQTLIFPTVDSTSNVASTFGGIVVYRTEEGEEFVESKAKFGRVKLDLTKQTALAHLTNELIRRSSPSISAILNQMMPQAFGFAADLDYLTGTGAGEPLGALSTSNPALTVVAKETSQAADTIVWQNVLRMYSRMLPQSIGRSVWLASPDTFVELATMALTVGTGGSAVWITDATGSPTLTLLGRPVIMTEKTPGLLGDQSDLSLVDFSFYLAGVQDSLMIDTSNHVRFTSDQTTIRAIQFNDGRPWLTSAITPQNNGPTLSPFVTLGARA